MVILSEDVHALGDAGEIRHRQARLRAQLPHSAGQGDDRHGRAGQRGRAQEAGHLREAGEGLDRPHGRQSQARRHLLSKSTAQAGDEGKLFGSVTAQNLAELLAEKGLDVDRRKIQLASRSRRRASIRLRSGCAAM